MLPVLEGGLHDRVVQFPRGGGEDQVEIVLRGHPQVVLLAGVDARRFGARLLHQPPRALRVRGHDVGDRADLGVRDAQEVADVARALVADPDHPDADRVDRASAAARKRARVPAGRVQGGGAQVAGAECEAEAGGAGGAEEGAAVDGGVSGSWTVVVGHGRAVGDGRAVCRCGRVGRRYVGSGP